MTGDVSTTLRSYPPIDLRLTRSAVDRLAAVVGASASTDVPPMVVALALTPAIRTVVEDRAMSIDPLGLLHGEQHMRFFRPCPAEESLVLNVAVEREAAFGFHRAIVIRSTVWAESEEVAALTTTLVDQSQPAPANLDRARPSGGPRLVETIDGLALPLEPDLPASYARASGDHHPIHLDDHFARTRGLPGVIVHGMCVLSLAVSAAADMLHGGEQTGLLQVHARFARPVQPGSILQVSVGRSERLGQMVLAVRADSRPVLRNAWIEVAW